MSRNGSGLYTPPGASFPAVATTLIESAKFNNIINDISTALSASIASDGQTTITANLPMANFKFTGLGTATATGQALTYNQVQDTMVCTTRFGYTTGAGGAVTQTTSKGTSVTLNKPTGHIITHSASIAANSGASFTFNNSFITSSNDYVMVHCTGDSATSTPGAYNIETYDHTSGACKIVIKNLTAGALAEVLTLRFFVIASTNS